MMLFRYSLRIGRNNAGVSDALDIVDRFVSLSYSRRLNAPGILTAEFERSDSIFASLQLDDDVWVLRGSKRKELGDIDSVDFYGLYRGEVERYAGGIRLRMIHCPSATSLLQRAIIAYRAGTEGATWTNSAVAHIAQQIVSENLDSSPLSDRLLTPAGRAIPTVYFNPAGASISYAAAYRNVLDALMELNKIGNYDFEVRYAPGVGLALSFDTQLGTDRSTTLFFEIGRGNLLTPVVDKRRIGIPTKVVVAGQGEGSTRMVEVRTASDYDSNTNHDEAFVDARHLDSVEGLQALGDSELERRAYKERVTFEAMQTFACAYGKHYFIGDTFSVIYGNTIYVQKLVGVTVNVNAQGERIQLELIDG